MTHSTPPDPDPTSSPDRSRAADFSASGDVQPGETPPAEDQVSAPQGHEEHGPRRGFSGAWVVATVAVAALVAVMLIAYGVGQLG